MAGGSAWVYLSISFEVHQIKGSKITDVDEVAIDSDGICVSERGPGELPAARGDLGVLKAGQASKDKNCQVLGGQSMRSAAAGAPLLGVTAWFGDAFRETSLQTHRLTPCSCSPRGRTGRSAPSLPAVKLRRSTGAGGEARVGPQGRLQRALLEPSPSARKEKRGRTPFPTAQNW